MQKSPVSSRDLQSKIQLKLLDQIHDEFVYVFTDTYAPLDKVFSRVSKSRLLHNMQDKQDHDKQDHDLPPWLKRDIWWGVHSAHLREVKRALERIESAPKPAPKPAPFRRKWPYLVLPILLNK